MASYRGLVGAGLLIGILNSMPCSAQTETPLGTFVVPLSPAMKEIQPVAEWSKQTLGLANTIWTESNETKRQQKLFEWAEQTPAQLAYVTRILKKNDVQQTGTIIVTLKDLFDLIKRLNWQPGDQPHMQRIVATWSAIVPQLVKSIPQLELSSSQRRNLEQALVDMVLISKNSRISTPVMSQAWQGQVASLGQMTRHPKTSVRLTSLSILEALGSDARPANALVQKSLSDSDRFVRWSAVRTLQAMGIDSATRQMLTRLQKDDDASVRQAVQLALQVPEVAGDSVAQKSRPALDLNVPIQPKNEEKPLSIPANTTGTVDHPVSELLPPPTPVKPTAPALIPMTIPQTPIPLPEKKVEPKSDPVPLFSPPSAQAPVKPPVENKNIQTTSSVTPSKQEPKVDPAVQWIPKLRQGTVDQQLLAVHELGKLGPDAARAVLPLAEMLLKGNVAVRREIPLTLIKIGTPAKVATAVLERSLQDSDTDVKVNAARALLELADK